MDGLGSCSRPRSGRRGSKEAREARDKNLNLVDVYDIAADIGKVNYFDQCLPGLGDLINLIRGWRMLSN